MLSYPLYIFILEAQCTIKSWEVRVLRPSCNQGHVRCPASLLHLCGPCPVKLHAHSPRPARLSASAAHNPRHSSSSASPWSSTLIAPCRESPQPPCSEPAILWELDWLVVCLNSQSLFPPPSCGLPRAYSSHSLSSLASCLVVCLVVTAPGFLHIRMYCVYFTYC